MHAIELKEENVEMVTLLLNAGAFINYGKDVTALAIESSIVQVCVLCVCA